MISYLKKFDYRIWVLAGGWVVSAIGFSLSIPFLSLYFHSDLGMSLSQIGLFFGASAIVRAIFQTLGGELSDRLGRYHLMVLAQLSRTVTFMAVAYSIYNHLGFLAIGGLIIFNSIFGAIFQPAANAAVADLVPPRLRSEGYAIVRVAGNFGWSIGPAIGGYVASDSYGFLFVISGCMTLLSSIVIAVFLRGIRQQEKRREAFNFKDIFLVKGNELLFRHIAFILILYLVIAQLIAPLSLYAVDFREITKKQLGFLFMLNGLLVALLQMPTTRLCRRYRLTSQLAAGSLVYAAGYFLVGLSSTMLWFVLAVIIITCGENLVSPPALAITANLAPPGRTGRYMGLYGFTSTLGWSLGPVLGGFLLDLFKPHFIYSWLVVSLLAIVSAAGFRSFSRRLPDDLNLYKE